MQSVTFSLVFENPGIGFTEHRLIKALAETFGSLSHFLINLLVDFGNLILDEHIGTITFL